MAGAMAGATNCAVAPFERDGKWWIGLTLDGVAADEIGPFDTRSEAERALLDLVKSLEASALRRN